MKRQGHRVVVRQDGERVVVTPAEEREHFTKCNTCAGPIDMRDLGEVLRHEGPHKRAES